MLEGSAHVMQRRADVAKEDGVIGQISPARSLLFFRQKKTSTSRSKSEIRVGEALEDDASFNCRRPSEQP
jgi:hypothetical protein